MMQGVQGRTVTNWDGPWDQHMRRWQHALMWPADMRHAPCFFLVRYKEISSRESRCAREYPNEHPDGELMYRKASSCNLSRQSQCLHEALSSI